MPFLNKSEATKRSRDRKENGECTNATNCRSRVGLSTSFCTGTYILKISENPRHKALVQVQSLCCFSLRVFANKVIDAEEQHTQGHLWKLFEPAVGSQASFFLTSTAAPIVEESHRTNLTCFMEFMSIILQY